MTSWKKSSKVNQHIHRQRHQPELRSHLGLLEKKEDYKSRANAFHRLQEKLIFLKKKAETRNPDEFHFHMNNSELVNGNHTNISKPLNDDTYEQRRLLEDKTMGYINMKRTVERRKVERMKSVLHFIGITKDEPKSHVFFYEDGDPTERRLDDKPVKMRTNLAENPYLRAVVPGISNRLKERQYRRLLKTCERRKQLGVIHEKMKMLQALRSKTSFKPTLVRKASKDQAPIYRWKYERKR